MAVPINHFTPKWYSLNNEETASRMIRGGILLTIISGIGIVCCASLRNFWSASIAKAALTVSVASGAVGIVALALPIIFCMWVERQKYQRICTKI